MNDRTARELIARAWINISDADRCVFMHIAPSAPTLLRSLREVTLALDDALDDSDRLAFIAKTNHGLYKSAEAELLKAQAAGRLVVQQRDAERERADAAQAALAKAVRS